MPICPNCHKEMKENAVRCIHCGQYLSDSNKHENISIKPIQNNMDLDPKLKEKFNSIWYFPENHPIAFLYDFLFFRISLNWLINSMFEYERKLKKPGLTSKISGGFDGMGSLYGGILVIIIWGGLIGALLSSPLYIITKGHIFEGSTSWIFLLFMAPGLYAANKIGNVRLEVMRAMRNAEQ